MSYEYTEISVRQPDSFNMLEYIRVGSVTLMRREQGEPYYQPYTPETISAHLFMGMLAEVGEVGLVEQYICPDTTLAIMRGCVMKNDLPYYFTLPVETDGTILKKLAESTIQCLKMSGEVSTP